MRLKFKLITDIGDEWQDGYLLEHGLVLTRLWIVILIGHDVKRIGAGIGIVHGKDQGVLDESPFFQFVFRPQVQFVEGRHCGCILVSRDFNGSDAPASVVDRLVFQQRQGDGITRGELPGG